MRYVHNAARQRQRLEQLLWTAEGANINRRNARQHLARNVCLYRQRYVAQIDVALIGVRIVEGQIHAFLALEIGFIVAHFGEYANLIDHCLDHIPGEKRKE